MSVDTSSTAMSMSVPESQREAEDSGSEHDDIIQDAQFFQDAATEYQLAYQSLDEKYMAQASKEFQHMWEPKITKLRGRYSADAELIFQSWRADMLANI